MRNRCHKSEQFSGFSKNYSILKPLKPRRPPNPIHSQLITLLTCTCWAYDFYVVTGTVSFTLSFSVIQINRVEFQPNRLSKNKLFKQFTPSIYLQVDKLDVWCHKGCRTCTLEEINLHCNLDFAISQNSKFTKLKNLGHEKNVTAQY